jgi:hydrogenase maturation factor
MKKKEQTPKGQTIARANARELTPEEVTIVSGAGCVCTCANTCAPCGPDDHSAN